jgi:hypothetical protein
MTDRPDHADAVDWSATTWEGHRRRQLERWSMLSLDEILDAQEQMAELAESLARGMPGSLAPSPSPRGRGRR